MKPSLECRLDEAKQILTRRSFLHLLGLAGASAALAACSPMRSSPVAESSEKVQLVYQDTSDGWFFPMVEEMLDQFHASHPNIQVYYVPEPASSEDGEQSMLDSLQTGSAPDIIQGCCTWFPVWAQKGYLLDLRPFVEADLDQETIEDWDTAQYRSLFTPDGRQFGLPKYLGSLALYYNKDLFDHYGVPYPDGSWTHDDYQEAMKRLTHDRDGDGQIDLWGSQTYITWDRIQMHINGWGGHILDPTDPRKSLLGKPEALAAQEWLRARMWDEQIMATDLGVRKKWPDDAFIGGQIAMLEDGSWRLRNILSNANFQVGVAPFPAGPVRRVTLATTDGFGIYAGTRYPEAAWELMKFLISKEFGRAMGRAGLLQPARASLIEEWAGFVREAFPETAKGMDVAAFADGQQKGYSVVAEVAANMAEATYIANTAWEELFILGQADVTIMKEAARQIDESQRVMG